MLRDPGFEQQLCADMQGFGLHAAVRCEADDRRRLKGLRRYIAHPTLANERVQCNAAGQVVLKSKTVWRDGTKHLVMSPLAIMQRLAALRRQLAPGLLARRPRERLLRGAQFKAVGVAEGSN